MPLIVEDGTCVADADTYVSAATARAYAAKRGVTLPVAPGGDAPDPVEVMLVKAMDWFYTKHWIGVQGAGVLQWPRKARQCGNAGFGYRNPILNGATIPTGLQNAQCQLCIELNCGVDLLPTTQGLAQGGGVVIEETTGPITTKYSERVGTASVAIMPAVDALLAGLIDGGSGPLRAGRV